MVAAVVGGVMVERMRNPGTSVARLLVLAVGAVVVVLVALLIYTLVSPWAPFANIPD